MMPQTETHYDRALRLVRDLVHERLGIYYDLDRNALLEDKLAPVLAARNLTSVLDYYWFLKEQDEDAWDELVAALTVNETYFWRETDQLTAAVEALVPLLLETKGSARILHAACASGEECYSLAMMLHRRGLFLRGTIDIVGTDVDRSVLGRAQRGIYERRSLRSLPVDVRDHYLQPADGRWSVRDSIRRRVRFEPVNLVNPQAVCSLGSFDLIFCRNVFIYFSSSVIQRVVSTFERALQRPGWLFLGASETLFKVATSLRLVEVGGAFAYTNEEGSGR